MEQVRDFLHDEFLSQSAERISSSGGAPGRKRDAPWIIVILVVILVVARARVEELVTRSGPVDQFADPPQYKYK